MSHQNNQPYSDGVTRTPGVPRWEYTSGLFMPTPGAAEHDDYDDSGSSVEVHCCRTPDTDLRTAPFRVRLVNNETGDDAAVVVPQPALIALASRLLNAALHGLPVGLTDGEYHGYYVDDDGYQRVYRDDADQDAGDGDQRVPAADEHHSVVPGAPGNVLRFPGGAGVDVSEDMSHLMAEIRGHCTPELDGDQDDDTPGGAA
ncbi:hypothetical protein ACTXMA_05170 [Corynebacterium variabile]|uniref:hypothetical protein n=1 Tax=Corynebacterium variabile TaxID=1727 RepID=UPI003F9DB489